MKPFFRGAVIEGMRLLALCAGATSAFLLTAFSIALLNVPYSLFYGPLPIEEWLLTVIAAAIAVAPAVFVAYVPSFAASAFDIRFSTRRLSQREKELVAKVQAVLEDCAKKSGIKLPQIVWRVQDVGEINAMAYAHNRVCFTKGMLHKYGDTQAGIERLAGVAAHEIGHLRNWDTRINMLLHYLTLPVNFGIGLANTTINRIPIIGLIFTLATVVFRLPCDIAHFLNGSTSQFQEYQADRFAAKLMNGVGISEFLDDISRLDERQGDTFSDWIMRTHPPTELRHDELTSTGWGSFRHGFISAMRSKILSGPHPGGVKHAQHSDRHYGFRIDNDVIRPNNQLACALNPARAAAFGMSRQFGHFALDFLNQGKSGTRVVIRDVIDNRH